MTADDVPPSDWVLHVSFKTNGMTALNMPEIAVGDYMKDIEGPFVEEL